MGRREWRPANALESELLAHRVVKASRQFLMANPEGKRILPPAPTWIAAADHAERYPGDVPLFEGQPAPKGRHAK